MSPSWKMRQENGRSILFLVLVLVLLLLVLPDPLVLDRGLGLYGDDDGSLLIVRAGQSGMMIMNTTLRMSLAMKNRAILMALVM